MPFPSILTKNRDKLVAIIILLTIIGTIAYFLRASIARDKIDKVKSNMEYASDEYTDIENKELLSDAIGYAPWNSEGYFLYGRQLHNEGKYDKALKFYNKAIEKDAERPDYYGYRSNCYSQLKDYKKAIRDISTCIKLDPDNLDNYFSRARLYGFSGNREAALIDYDHIINRDDFNNPKFTLFAMVLNNKAFSLIELGKPYEGLPLINKAIQLKQDEDTFYGTRGELYFSVDDFDKAYNDFNKAIKIYEGNKGQSAGDAPASYYYYRGLIHTKYGLLEASRVDLQEAVDLGFIAAAEPLHQVESALGVSLITNE